MYLKVRPWAVAAYANNPLIQSYSLNFPRERGLSY